VRTRDVLTFPNYTKLIKTKKDHTGRRPSKRTLIVINLCHKQFLASCRIQEKYTQSITKMNFFIMYVKKGPV